jgi:PAS domain S-box-containing protein
VQAGQDLRRLAEERMKVRGTRLSTLDTQRLTHELQVHQVELEMQNEELQQARAKADALLAQYTDLYDSAPTGYLTLDREGAIRQVNLTGARLLGIERSRLVNRRFGLFVAESDRCAFSAFLQKIYAGESEKGCDLELPQEGRLALFVHIQGKLSADGQECRAVVLDITERKQAEDALRQSAAELHSLAAHLNAVREEERAALARELHDDLGQHLTALQIDLMWLDHRLQAVQPPDLAALRNKIAGVVPLVEHLTELTQTISSSLRPGVLDDLGLVAALEWQAEDTAKRTGLTGSTALPASDIEVDGTIALAVFRIVQESLTNVVRHAQATHVTIGLHRAGNVLELEIQDNGRGGAPGTFAGHRALGLIGMREGATICVGTIAIGSEPGKGITVRIPAHAVNSDQ